MCGLFAALSRRKPIGQDFAGQLDMLAHRGPDDCGIQLVSLESGPEANRPNRAWLGHRRLSIIDPQARGAQPMSCPDNRYTVVFNGEIYNYLELKEECVRAGWAFRTETDTEVLLASWALWGTAAVRRFTGMFAFVIIDKSVGKGWLVRDAFGIKPLYYAKTPDSIYVASELPPIVSLPNVEFAINPLQSLEYIRFGASTSRDKTLISGIGQLPPATIAEFDFISGQLSLQPPFWGPLVSDRSISFHDAADECRSRFLTNVKLHLRSDVPVGAALSGGLDSSAIVCAMRHLEPDLEINSFSFISSEPAQSEERWVDIVNKAVGAKAHKVVPHPGDLASDLPKLIAAQGEPFGTASIYAQYRVFECARANGVPVTLDGQGADEILGGYTSFVGTHVAERAKHGQLGEALAIIRHGGRNIRESGELTALAVQSALPDHLKRLFRQAIGRRLFPAFCDEEWFHERGVGELDVVSAAISSHPNLKAHLQDSLVRSSLPTLLRFADRNSMASSIESRVPFLTPDFVDFLLSLPAEYLISDRGVRKHVFREAMKGILPEEIRTRSDKIGFFADDRKWIRANETFFRDYVPAVEDVPQFSKALVRKRIEDFFAGRNEAATEIWRIFIFAMWRQHMKSLRNS